MGGQERVALDLSVGQRGLGHRLFAVSISDEPGGTLAEEFRKSGVEVFSVPKRPGFDPTLFVRLGMLFRRLKLDIVHTHNPQPLIYAALPARVAGAQVVHTKHGANPDSLRRLMLRRGAAKLAGAYVAVSETTAEVARQRHEMPPATLVVIPNGIDLSRFHPDLKARQSIRRELGITESAFVIGTVGRLAPEKNQALLLGAAGALLSDKIRLVIVGDGSEAPALAKIVADATSWGRWVCLTGARSDAEKLLNAFDVFVLSSRTEGLPLVIPEAMATALPVVSTAVGGIPQVVEEGVTGYLVPPGDEAALAGVLRRLVDNRGLARELGAKARQIALTKYSRDRMVEGYVDLYEQLVSPPHRLRASQPAPQIPRS